MSTILRLYERLGLSPKDINATNQIRRAENQKAREIVFVEIHKWMLVKSQASAALACYLEELHDESVARAREVVTLTIDLFFGAWRKGVPDPKHGGLYPEYRWLKKVQWVCEYRDAILWSACLGDWDAARRLSQYPSDQTDSDISERKSEAPWYRLLASYLRGDATGSDLAMDDTPPGEPSGKPGTLERLIEEGRSKRMKHLSAALGAIARKDAAAVQDRIEQCLAYYRKTEFTRGDWDDMVAIDGSILVHLAEHEGVPVSVPEKYADYIVRLPPDLVKATAGTMDG